MTKKFLTISEGESALSAKPVLSTNDPRAIEAALAAVADRIREDLQLDEDDEEIFLVETRDPGAERAEARGGANE